MEFTDFDRAWRFLLGTSRHGVVVSHLRTLPTPKPDPTSILALLSGNLVETQDTARVELQTDGANWKIVYDEYRTIVTLKPIHQRWEVTIMVRTTGDKFVPAPMDHYSVESGFAALLGVDAL